MGSVTVNFSNIDKLAKQLKDAHKASVQAGWFESAKYQDGAPVAGIMAQNEFGNSKIGIPARPFFRPAIEDNKKAWAKIVGNGFKAALNGQSTPDNVLNMLGLKVVSDVKIAITTGDHVALSPITIALRKLRNEGVPIGGSTVGAVASAIANGQTGRGELGDQSFGNKNPLRETGYAMSTLTYEVS